MPLLFFNISIVIKFYYLRMIALYKEFFFGTLQNILNNNKLSLSLEREREENIVQQKKNDAIPSIDSLFIRDSSHKPHVASRSLLHENPFAAICSCGFLWETDTTCTILVS